MASRGTGRGVAAGSWAISLPLGDPLDSADLSATRDICRSVLHNYPDAAVLDALLVMDALISDAVRWNRTLREVRLRSGPRLGIEVTSAPAVIPPPPAHITAAEGLGRLVLEELTRAWDVERGECEHTVWADLAGSGLPAPAG